MKIKAFVISGLLAIFSTTQVWASNLDIDDQTTKANLIKLAPAETLKENINKALGNSHFLERTGLYIQLAGTSKSLEEIDLAINFAICGYVNSFSGNSLQTTMQRLMFLKKPLLKQAILKFSQPN